jgi:hypothetical protein
MNLPNADRAVVDIAKLRDYCLSPIHRQGKFKTKVFLSSLGIGTGHANLLREWLVDAAINSEASPGRKDAFGDRFIVDFVAQHKSRSATIRSIWIVRSGEDFPRLVTSYVI